MKITTVRFRRLESHKHGYGHDAVEAEAQVEEGESPDVALSNLQEWVLGRLRYEQEVDARINDLERLRDSVTRYERQIEGLKDDIDRNRKIIADHERLAELAREHGLDAESAELGDGIPF